MRLCFFGDSFVNGVGDPDGIGWVGRLCAQANANSRDITVYNLGIRRATSEDVARRWHAEASARILPEHDGRLLFSFGANDCVIENCKSRVTQTDTVAAVTAILDRATVWAPTVFVGPPPLGDAAVNFRISGLNSILADVCAGHGVPYFDAFGPLSASEIWRQEVAAGDGAHPGRRGYALLAALVGDWFAWRAWSEAG